LTTVPSNKSRLEKQEKTKWKMKRNVEGKICWDSRNMTLKFRAWTRINLLEPQWHMCRDTWWWDWTKPRRLSYHCHCHCSLLQNHHHRPMFRDNLECARRRYKKSNFSWLSVQAGGADDFGLEIFILWSLDLVFPKGA